MRALKLGKFFDIEVYVHWTFALLVGYVLYKFWDKGGLEMGLYVLGLLLAMFGCVLLHEFGHALMARYFCVPTRDITLYPIGGIARLERMPERPVEELLIALAGPAVNIVIAILLFVPAFLSLSAVANRPAAALEEMVERSFVFQLFAGNLILAGFNLLPAFPMDGGRVLRALLAGWLGRIRATEVAAGRGFRPGVHRHRLLRQPHDDSSRSFRHVCRPARAGDGAAAGRIRLGAAAIRYSRKRCGHRGRDSGRFLSRYAARVASSDRRLDTDR